MLELGQPLPLAAWVVRGHHGGCSVTDPVRRRTIGAQGFQQGLLDVMVCFRGDVFDGPCGDPTRAECRDKLDVLEVGDFPSSAPPLLFRGL